MSDKPSEPKISLTSGDLKAGIRYDDLTRISAYDGRLHLHFGANSPSITRAPDGSLIQWGPAGPQKIG